MAIIVGTSGPDTLDGTADADRLYGLEDNDTLNGLAGNDLLDGGTGNDTMNGGADDDIYVIDSAGDLINESVGQGFDIAYALASYVLAAGVSLERLSSHDHLTTTALDLTGNDIVTDIYGNAGTNVLTGGAANNIILGFGGTDTLNGLGGNDLLYGMDGVDTMNGGADNDFLDGGAGDDTMAGGAGDDIYLVNALGDSITETTGQGFDIVYALSGYVLAAGVDVERLSSADHLSTTAMNLTGNDIVANVYGNNGGNVLTGGAAANVLLGFGGVDTLNGLGGQDSLFGMDGVDTLNGGADNDFLVGGAGNDFMNGGTGDDVFLIEGTDTIGELAGEGFDIVYAAATYALTAGAHVERLSSSDHLSTAAQNLTGNDIVVDIYGNNGVNVITGGAANNYLLGFGGNDRLNGGAGHDVLFGMDGMDDLRGDADNDVLYGGNGIDQMYGGAGIDTYIVEQSSDMVHDGENEGNDLIYSYVDYRLLLGAFTETLATIDSTAVTQMRLFGNEWSNTVSGDDGNNLLDTGEGGTDTLVGWGGADIFNFRNMTAAFGMSKAFALGVATIDDFVQGTDKIRLDTTKFTTLLGGGSGILEIGATATSASTRLLYDPATGNLIYDTDGNVAVDTSADPGAIFGRIQTGLTLTLSDFIIVANAAPEANDDAYAMNVGTVDSTIHINMKQNDFDLDGLRLWVTRAGVDSGSMINIGTGLFPTSINGTYGRLEGGSKSNDFDYRLDVDDADTIAIAPGTTVTETFVYEVTDGMSPAPLLGTLTSYALFSLATITISITRSATGALISSTSAPEALAAPPADDQAAFASAPDAAFAPVGGGEELAASPSVRAAADYLVADLWIA